MSSIPIRDQEEMMAKGVVYIAAAASVPEIASLYERISSLYSIVDSLRSEIVGIKRQLKDIREKSIPITEEFRLVSQEIVESVASYLREKKEAYPSDIADELGISIKQVMSAISILKQSKRVGEA